MCLLRVTIGFVLGMDNSSPIGHAQHATQTAAHAAVAISHAHAHTSHSYSHGPRWPSSPTWSRCTIFATGSQNDVSVDEL